MQPPVVPGSDRDVVEAFVRVGRHALHTGGMGGSNRQIVDAALTEMSEELARPYPDWTRLEQWALRVRAVVQTGANPAVATALTNMRWPPRP